VLLAKADLEEAVIAAKALALWPMRLVILGVFLNFTFLIVATLVPDGIVSFGWSAVLIFGSVGPYLLGFFALWWVARYKYDSVLAQIEAAKS